MVILIYLPSQTHTHTRAHTHTHTHTRTTARTHARASFRGGITNWVVIDVHAITYSRHHFQVINNNVLTESGSEWRIPQIKLPTKESFLR